MALVAKSSCGTVVTLASPGRNTTYTRFHKKNNGILSPVFFNPFEFLVIRWLKFSHTNTERDLTLVIIKQPARGLGLRDSLSLQCLVLYVGLLYDKSFFNLNWVGLQDYHNWAQFFSIMYTDVSTVYINIYRESESDWVRESESGCEYERVGEWQWESFAVSKAFTGTSLRKSQVNFVACAQLTFQILTLRTNLSIPPVPVLHNKGSEMSDPIAS